MRSTGRIAVDRLAAGLGGGGHPHAAGVALRATRAEARERILPELHRLVAALGPPAGPCP
jgi:nanoRNase/pAp phosphatase (c-di-AMP/oligoRNAs hydrolase)